MKKGAFLELVQRFLTGGDLSPDLDEKYDTRIIEATITTAYANAMYQFSQLHVPELDLYTKRYIVDVNYDEEVDEYYSELPSPVAQMRMNTGIHKISPVKERWSFNPISQLSEDVFGALEVGRLAKDPSYYFDSTRVYYQYYDWKHKHIQKVRMFIIPPFDSYSDDDELLIPAGKEDMILQFVSQYLGSQGMSDDSPNLDEKQMP